MDVLNFAIKLIKHGGIFLLRVGGIFLSEGSGATENSTTSRSVHDIRNSTSFAWVPAWDDYDDPLWKDFHGPL